MSHIFHPQPNHTPAVRPMRRLTQPVSRALLPLLLIVGLLMSGLAQPAAAKDKDKGKESRVLPALQLWADQHPDDMFRVIVTRTNRDKNADKKVKDKGGKKHKDIPAEAFVADVKGSDIRELGTEPAVKFVAPDAEVRSTCAGCSAVSAARLGIMYPMTTNASAVWPSTQNGTGWTGKGVGVAVIDTGINPNRKDWDDALGHSRIVTSTLFSPYIEHRDDGHGHGTHVAGIIGGNSWRRTETTLQGKYVGVAPEVNLLDIKVANDWGKSYTSDVVMALDWIVAHRVEFNIRVINLSMVSTVAESYKTSVLAAAVERAWFNGILVVVASGNSGPDTLRYPPANDPFVLTVGATDTNNTATQSDDFLAPWSSYGTTQDGVSKPDVVAPGRRIVAPLTSLLSTLSVQMPSRIVDSSYIWLSGTSMATPVVVGVAALGFQAHPEWSNDQMKTVLMQTATKLGTVSVLGAPLLPLAGSGAGEVNAAAVVNYVGVPVQANVGISINERLLGPDGALVYTSNAIATSSSAWTSSAWTSSAWTSSAWTSSAWTSSNAVASTDETEPSNDVANFEIE